MLNREDMVNNIAGWLLTNYPDEYVGSDVDLWEEADELLSDLEYGEKE